MIGDIKADQFTLPVQHLTLVYITDIGKLNLFHYPCKLTEERHLPGFGGAEMIATDGHNPVKRSEQRGAVSKRIHRSHFDQTFEGALAHSPQIHAAGKVI